MDLVGAFPDLGDFGVAHQALHPEIAAIAIAAKHLHRFGGHPHRQIRGAQLGHRGFEPKIGLALLDHRGHMIEPAFGQGKLGGKIRQGELVALEVEHGLAALHEEDPTFLYVVDGELHQTIISAQGELHLEVVADRLRRRHNVHVELAEPRVKYRETIKDRGEAKYRHKKQTGGAGQFAEVWMRIEPRPRDSGVLFTQSLVGQNVDRNFVPSVEKGVQQVCAEGVIAGCGVTDVKVDFYDGKMHPVDSKDIAFQIAGYFAFKEAFAAAKPMLLEPIEKVEIHVPEAFLGKVMGDLSSRRGKILGIETEGAFQVIKATVPTKDLYHYSSTLRSLTGGGGVHTEAFSHYEEMPREAAEKVIAEAAKRKAAENNHPGH